MIVCHHCGKGIRGEHVEHTLPMVSKIGGVGGLLHVSHHPKCWDKAEAEAEAELKRSEKK